MQTVLSINGGSSSIKFALYKIEDPLQQLLLGAIEKIGAEQTTFRFNNTTTNINKVASISASTHNQAIDFLIDWLEREDFLRQVKVIGHRLVHGMKHSEPELITNELLADLKKISPVDPEHLPDEIRLIEAFKKSCPSIMQVALFDTAFHTSMPAVAKLLPIPRRYNMQRYGFHGLSYNYLIEEIERIAGTEAAQGKIILAHLGSGASLAAVKDGKSMDTSMGFSPTAGLPMSTRTGDIDPGALLYLMQTEGLTTKQFGNLINHQSGLLGVSETSGDMQELLKIQSTDNRAAEAVELFCYQTRKWIGSFAAALEGLDTLVFSGGIGEHAAEIRWRICAQLQFLGIELDDGKNKNNEAIISKESSKINVRVINTNEEIMIAKLASQFLNNSIKH